MAPQGGLLVRTAHPSINALGTRYGPVEKHTALASTWYEVDAYAPPSSSIRASTLTRQPSAPAVWRYHKRAGCRWTWPRKDSSLEYTILTGRPVRRASKQA